MVITSYTTSYLVIKEQDDLLDYLYNEMLCCKTPEHLCDFLAAFKESCY